MFCIKCGKQNIDEAVYCSFCGTRLSEKEAENITNQITKQDNTEPVEAEYIIEDDLNTTTETTNVHSTVKGSGETEDNYKKHESKFSTSNKSSDPNNKSNNSFEDDPARIYLVITSILVLLIAVIISKVVFSVMFMIELFAFLTYKSLVSNRYISSNLTTEFGKIKEKIKGNRVFTYFGIGVFVLLIGLIIFFNSDHYNMMGFENSINSLIENENTEELQTQIDNLLPAAHSYIKSPENSDKIEKLNYVVENLLKSNSSNLKSFLEDSYDYFDLRTQEKILTYYKEHNLRFSTVTEILAKLPIKLEYGNTENINRVISKLKTHLNSEIITEFEKVLINDVNNSDANSNFLSIKEKIHFLRTTFVSSNDSAFYQLESIFSKLSEIKEKLNDEVVSEPSKPIYYKPEYNGASYMYGEYVGPYNGGGVVLRVRGKYFLVENGAESRNPFARYYYGYYEKTGKFFTLNIGRNGTSCEILVLRDEETYRDDQNDYQNKVNEAQENYSREMKEYQEDLVKYRNYSVQNQSLTQQINQLISKAKALAGKI